MDQLEICQDEIWNWSTVSIHLFEVLRNKIKVFILSISARNTLALWSFVKIYLRKQNQNKESWQIMKKTDHKANTFNFIAINVAFTLVIYISQFVSTLHRPN